MFLYMRDIVKGMRRRKKELLLIVTVEFAAVLFVMAALLFQHNAEKYTFETNRYVYGDWCIAEVITGGTGDNRQLADHPYFEGCGIAVSGLILAEQSPAESAGKGYNFYIGLVDDTLKEIGHIALREGRFPENEQEIVMGTEVLAELGYSFETGQKIPLFIQEDAFGNGRMETFELVGVLKGSLDFWNVGMPDVLVTKEVLDSAWFQQKTICCYYPKEQYAQADMEELFLNLQELHEEERRMGWQIVYNSNLYSTSFWNGTELYQSVEAMVLVAGMAAMSFLLAAYIQKRKQYYYSLRIIGMSGLRVRIVTLWELFCACVPGVVLGIPVGLLLGAVVCGGLTVAKKLEWFYEVPASLVGKAILMWLLIFVASALLALLITGGRRLYRGSQTISLRLLPRWSLNKLRHNRRYSSIFIREHRVFELRSLLGSLVSILFTTLLMLCGLRLWEQYESYRKNTEEIPHFRYYRAAEEYKEEGRYHWKKGSREGMMSYQYGDLQLREGFSDQFFTLLKEIPGVVSYTYGIMDNAHLFEWENMQEDPYITNLRDVVFSKSHATGEDGKQVELVDRMDEVLPENSLYFGYTSWFPQEGKKIFDLYYDAWGNELMDYESFAAGEQVFLINNEPGLLIKPGDSLWIVAGEEKVEVMVAAVISQTEVEMAYYPGKRTSLALDAALANKNRTEREEWGTNIRKLYLVGSEQLAGRIAEAEGAKPVYNWIDLILNPMSDYNLTVKQCIRLLAAEKTNGTANYDLIQKALNEWVNSVILYGTFFVLLTAFFLILRGNFIQSGFTFQGDRMKRLRMLGMEKRQLRNMNLLQGLYEARGTWLAVPVVYGVKLYQYARSLVEDTVTGQWSIYLEETGKMSSDVKEILMYRWDDQMTLWVCLVVLVLMLLLHVLTRYLVSRGAIAALDEKEQEG